MNEFVALLRRHKSVREFAPEPVPEDEWREMLRAGQQASTDATGQLYCAVEVRDPALRKRIATLAGDQRHIHSAPRFLVVCVDVRRLRLLLEHRGEMLGIRAHVALLFGITDASLFAQTLTVAAEASGYGVCYIGAVQNHPQEIARDLQLPEGVVPLWGLTVGRPLHKGSPKPRTPTDLVIHIDRYRDPAPNDLDRNFETMKAATRSGDWLNPIRKYFAAGGIMEQRESGFHELLRSHGLDPCETV